MYTHYVPLYKRGLQGQVLARGQAQLHVRVRQGESEDAGVLGAGGGCMAEEGGSRRARIGGIWDLAGGHVCTHVLQQGCDAQALESQNPRERSSVLRAAEVLCSTGLVLAKPS